jgi:hypothetical protein
LRIKTIPSEFDAVETTDAGDKFSEKLYHYCGTTLVGWAKAAET